MAGAIASSLSSVRAAAKTGIFLLKVLPTLPSRPLDRLTPSPVIESVHYPTPSGVTDGELYRPATGGPHPGIVVCLGVVPFGRDHPQVPRLGEALARSGFAALLYWSPHMRRCCLDPVDIEGIALAYRWLVERPDVDPARSGLLGTCVGGSFALMAAASPLIRERVAFVAAFGPYGSMWNLARQIASSTRIDGEENVPWSVDPLTRAVYVRSLTDALDAGEAELLRRTADAPGGVPGSAQLSTNGRAVASLLTALTDAEAEDALRRLPAPMRARLTALSPERYLTGIRAPVIALAHDRDDRVVPVGESRRLLAATAGRAGVHYTEFRMFAHMDPTKVRLSPLRLLWELGKFYGWLYPIFRRAEAP
jgi:hypothetical protein